MAKSLKEKFNEKPSVVRYQGPYEDFEFETSTRRLIVKRLADRLAVHGLRFTALDYYSKHEGVSVTSSGTVKTLSTLKYKLKIEGCDKEVYWEVDFSSLGTNRMDQSNIVIDGVSMTMTKFRKLCELKTALLFV